MGLSARFFNQEEMEKEILKEKEAGEINPKVTKHDLKKKINEKISKLS